MKLRRFLLAAALLTLTPFLSAFTGRGIPGNQGTVITIQGNHQFQVGDDLRIVLLLTTESGAPLYAQPIEVFLDGEIQATLETDPLGAAVFQMAPLPAGSYTLEVVYHGMQRYADSTAEIALEISPAEIVIETVPAIPDLAFAVAGQIVRTGTDGIARVPIDHPGAYSVALTQENAQALAEAGAVFKQWFPGGFDPESVVFVPGNLRLQAGFEFSFPVSFEFFDPQGNPVNPERIDSIVLRGSDGSVQNLTGVGSYILNVNRIIARLSGLDSARVVHSIQSVLVDGADVVNQGQQRFFIVRDVPVEIDLLMYDVRFYARDLFFGFHNGRAVELIFPNGEAHEYPLGPGGDRIISGLPRGEYQARLITDSGVAPAFPLVLSRDQAVRLPVVTLYDLAAGAAAALAILIGLPLFGRRRLIWTWLRRRLAALSTGLFCLVVIWVSIPGSAARAAPALREASKSIAPPENAGQPVPILAYYYIWYDESSWDRAKTDYPTLGRYSSDDRTVMAQHIQWAIQSGIDGFIVSWKSTETLNTRLEQLVEVAAEYDFKLGIIYQGLDFERDPLPAERITADLEFFNATYGQNPVFDIFGKPLVIWSGTWKYTREEIEPVSARFRDTLHLLASERNLDGYLRVSDLFEGNAYYWSSVDPDTFPGYQAKLDGLSDAIHERGGLWIAPAAPGFDARLIGGVRVVERQDGLTLLKQLQTAYNSSPDAIGLISWNEFSENTQIEPSENFGTQYLEVLADYSEVELPNFNTFNSSDPPEAGPEPAPNIPEGGPAGMVVLLSGLALLALMAAAALRRR